MHGKEFWADCLRTFFTVVTLINVLMFLLGSVLLPELRFGYEAFIVPVIYGLVGTLPNLVLYSKRELKIGELMVRKVLQLILIEVLVLFVAFYNTTEEVQSVEIMVSTVAGVFVVYVIATLVDILENFLSAKQMTEDLKRFQKNNQA